MPAGHRLVLTSGQLGIGADEAIPVDSEAQAELCFANIAAILAEASGVDPAAEQRSVNRAEFTFGPLDDDVIVQQQAVADRFQKLGLIPEPIRVRDIVWPWKSNT